MGRIPESPADDALSERPAAEPRLRGRLIVYGLAALSEVGAARSSVVVFIEWFLRDAYGMKARGVISLGLG